MAIGPTPQAGFVKCPRATKNGGSRQTWFRAAFVKDYQMPAREQELADYISIWGRRQIILMWPIVN